MNESPLEKPEPPEPWECCAGGACQPCVWDSYYEALRAWQSQQMRAKASQETDQNRQDV